MSDTEIPEEELPEKLPNAEKDIPDDGGDGIASSGPHD